MVIDRPAHAPYYLIIESLCAIKDQLNIPPYTNQFKFDNSKELLQLEVFLTNFFIDEEFGAVFSLELITDFGQLLVQSEKKSFYVFKAIDKEQNNENEVPGLMDTSLFPEKKQYSRRVLITGGCGFLGRNFVNKFCDSGYLVFIIDNLQDSDSLIPNKFPIMKCDENQLIFKQVDYLDYLQNDSTFTTGMHKLNVFVHLASNDKVMSNSLDSIAFQFAIRSRPDNMIFFSDSSLTSDKNSLKMEQNLDMSNSNFSFLFFKQNGERLAKILFENYNIPVSIYRLPHVYGEEQSPSESPFISILNQVMEKRNNPVNSQVIMMEYDISIDFVYVDDVVSCVMNTFSLGKRDAVNLSSGVFTSMSSLAKLMTKQAGYKNDPEIYFLRNMKVLEKETLKNNNFRDNMICQLPTTIELGVEALVENYLDKEIKQMSKIEIDKKIESELYSSYKCLGGSQLFSDFNVEHYSDDFPAPGDPSFRVCHFKNVCLSGGKMQYFKDPQLQNLPTEFKIDSFQNSTETMFRVRYSRAHIFKLEIELFDYPLFSSTVKNQTVFVDHHTYSNFGHMLHDNIIPHFAGAKLFNLSLAEGQIIYQYPCTSFFRLDQNKICVDDLSETFEDRCLKNVKAFSIFFFSKPPLFLSEMDESKCYSDLLIGQGSTFSFYSLDLSRSLYISDVTQHILKKYPILDNYKRSRDSFNILVAKAGKKIENDFVIDLTVCERIKFCVDSTHFAYQSSFFPLSPVVNCIVPESLSLLEQVIAARQAHVIVSYDGALAHLAMFAQANTQQIVIKKSNVRDLKFVVDTHVFLWTNHLHTLYVKQSDYYKEICSILFLSFKNYLAFM